MQQVKPLCFSNFLQINVLRADIPEYKTVKDTWLKLLISTLGDESDNYMAILEPAQACEGRGGAAEGLWTQPR